MGQRGDTVKINFSNFQMEKWVSETVRARKTDEKNGVIFQIFMSPSWVMILKLSKIVSFLQFFADFSFKSKTVIAVYVYALESSRSLLENGIGYEFCLIFADSTLFWYFIPQYLVNSCSDPYKTYYFLKENDRSFWWI